MVRLTSEGSHLNPKLCLHWLFKGAAAKIPVCLLAVGRYWLETTPKSPVRGLGFLEEGALSEDPDCLLELGFFGRALDLSRPILWPQSSTVTSPLLSEAGKLLKTFRPSRIGAKRSTYGSRRHRGLSEFTARRPRNN